MNIWRTRKRDKKHFKPKEKVISNRDGSKSDRENGVRKRLLIPRRKSQDKKPITLQSMTVSEASYIHDFLIKQLGGQEGYISKSNLEFILATMDQIGRNARTEYEATMKKATYLLHSLTTLHPFVNGNKRTAWVLSESFLNAKGYAVTATDEQIVNLLMGVAKGKHSMTEIEHWLSKHLRKTGDNTMSTEGQQGP